MSVEVIIGRAGTGKTFFCLQQMKKILQTSPLDTKIIFLLPAYQTYRAELELAEITGGAVNTRMCSFQRLARQILSEVGGAIIPRISEIGRRILLRKILINRTNDLKFFKKSAGQRGFAENLSQELQELRTYSIDSEKIREILKNIENDELKDKIFDLAILSEDFRNAIADKQNDESDLIEKAAELIKFSDDIKTSEIFIDGFIFFDPQQRKILREIFIHAKNVHIVLPMDTDLNSRENINPLGIFNRSFETFKSIKNLAAEVKKDFKIVRCEKFRRFENETLKIIEQNIFGKKFFVQKKFDDFKIVEAVNKRVEVEAVAQDILKIHEEKNFRFREIGIISRDESYSNLLKPIFEIHGIPFFIDNKRAATHHPFAEFIRSTLETLRTWRAEPIFRTLRTGFFDIPAEKIDLLENYVIEFGIRGEKIWTQSEDWTKHRHRLDENLNEPSKSEIERLAEINKIREEIFKPLIKFSKSVKKKNSALEFVTALYSLTEELKIHEKLVEMSEIEEKRGNLSMSKENLKIWDDVINLFEQVADSMGDEIIDARKFELIINEGLDALEMSIIPPGIDEVTISQFDQNSLQNSRAIYLLGFSDADFPKRADEKLLLTDADRLTLNENHLEISKGGQERIFAEKFLIYRGLTEAKNYLYISYPLADSEGKAMHPARLIEKLKNMFAIEKVETKNLDILKNLGSAAEYSLTEKTLSSDTAKKLYAPSKKLRGSVTKFETFNKCPFQYFANYGLKLQERREYKVKAPDIGDILHTVMKNFGEQLKDENKRWASVDDEDLKNRVTKILDELTTNLNNKILLTTNAYKHRRERIKKVAISSLKRLIELDRNSKFHPELFEKNFNELDGKFLAYEINDTKIDLTGIIDRIDFNEDGKYFLIIDYKTGKAYLNLTEVFYGVNLQLLTYLAAAKKLDEVGEKMPAGMLYYFLKYPSERIDTIADADKKIDNALKSEGWYLDNEDVVYQIDSSLNSIKVKFLAGGGFNKNTEKNIVKSEGAFKKLIEQVDKIFQSACKQILSGEISAKPFQTKKMNACDYCIYSELCGFDSKNDKGNSPTLDDNEILKIINGLEENDDKKAK